MANHTQDARNTALGALGVVVVMGGLAFAAVPLYDLFCRVTGFGGTPLRVDELAVEAIDRTIEVRFDASLNAKMPWRFEPLQRKMELRIGEMGLAHYRAHNPTDQTITGSATFNVTPLEVGGYFAKIECFCFTEQTLKPGETVDMPVTFYVDPEIVEDPDYAGVQSITLSYTFFETERVAGDASAAHAPQAEAN